VPFDKMEFMIWIEIQEFFAVEKTSKKSNNGKINDVSRRRVCYCLKVF